MAKLLYSIRLNGVGLETLDPRIRIGDISEKGAKIKVTTASNGPYGGLRPVKRERQTRAVTVTFKLWEKDKTERFALLGLIAAWADGGGRLTAGHRDGQYLNVLCDSLPDISGKNWTEDHAVTFTSYDPYWRGADPVQASLAVTANVASEKTIWPNGTAAETFLEFEIRNTGTEPMTSATVSVGDASFALSGFSLAAGKTLTAAYDDSGFLQLKADDVSVMDKRSALSADDLVIAQRAGNTVSVETDQAAAVVLKTYEKWL